MATDFEEEIFPIGDLLAGPITAIQEAQIEAERRILEFILEYGMEEYVERVGSSKVTGLRLRTMDFQMSKSVPDPANAGSSINRQVDVQAPLLSIIRLPALGIDGADIELGLDIELSRKTTLETQKAAGVETTDASTSKLGLPRKKVSQPQLQGTVGTRSSNRNFRTKGRMDFHLKLKTAEDDDVYGRLVRFIAEGISANVNLDAPAQSPDTGPSDQSLSSAPDTGDSKDTARDTRVTGSNVSESKDDGFKF